MRLKLHWQVFIAMGLGLAFALIAGERAAVAAPLGTIFMRLLRMVIVPLIFTSIVSGVAGIGDARSVGRVGAKTMLYYVVSSLVAIIIGLTLTNLIRPGLGLPALAAGAQEIRPEDLETPGSPFEILIRMIPLNPLSAAASDDILGLIFFSIVFGLAMNHLPEQPYRQLLKLFQAAFEVMMKLTGGIMRLLPIGVFGLISSAVASMGFGVFEQVGKYMLTIAIGLSIHYLLVLPTLFFAFTRLNPLHHYRAMAPAMVTAFSTSSSSATLPVTMETLEERAGVSNKVASFVLPMGATINMDGTALYECAGALFIAQALGADLTLAQQGLVVLTALLASIGAASIPSAGLVMIFIVLQAVGLDNPAAYAIVGLMLGVDRPLDMFRTMVNVTSDSVGAAIVAQSEGETLAYAKKSGKVD
jgi:Na+/H+-dicarboxylate symporter